MLRLITVTFETIVAGPLDLNAVMAFRGSGKSTIMNTVNVLWSILGKPGKKFVLVVSKTQEQAKNHFANIKAELEGNQWLREDFGPFAEKPEEWNKLSLELEYHGAKIVSATIGESLRGMKYRNYRPDLVICDDLQDWSPDLKGSTRHLFEKFDQEIVPLGTVGTRIVVLGNFIGEYSFMARLEEDMRAGYRQGMFRAYPLRDHDGRILWPEKFTNAALETLKKRVSPQAWAGEYMLDESYEEYTRSSPEIPDIFQQAEAYISRIPPSDHFKEYRRFAQIPLIPQMRKYVIITPGGDKALEEDPEYQRCMYVLADALVEAQKAA